MDSKVLLAALIGFFLGGLVVSVAATMEARQAEEMKNDQGAASVLIEAYV